MQDGDDDEEGSNIARYPCLPSLIALQQMRNRLHMAHDNKRLMKWSAMASGKELRRLAKDMSLIYDSFTEDVRDAFIILARCRYFYPNLNKMVVENVGTKACVTLSKNSKSVAGCKLTTFSIEDNCPDAYPCLGIDRGGDVISEAKRLWHELLRRMITMEQLRSNFMDMDISHRNANKKSMNTFMNTSRFEATSPDERNNHTSITHLNTQAAENKMTKKPKDNDRVDKTSTTKTALSNYIQNFGADAKWLINL